MADEVGPTHAEALQRAHEVRGVRTGLCPRAEALFGDLKLNAGSEHTRRLIVELRGLVETELAQHQRARWSAERDLRDLQSGLRSTLSRLTHLLGGA